MSTLPETQPVDSQVQAGTVYVDSYLLANSERQYIDMHSKSRTDPHVLLRTAETLGNSADSKQLFFSAAAFAELNLVFPSWHNAENQVRAYEAFDASLACEQNPKAYFETKRLQICLPLFSLPSSIEALSSEELDAGITGVRDDVFGLLQEIHDYAAPEYPGLEAELLGLKNELVILASLLNTELIRAGSLALPALPWQDMGMDTQKVQMPGMKKPINRRIDMSVVSTNNASTQKRVQIKTGSLRSGVVYESDITVLVIRKIYNQVAAKLSSGAETPIFDQLYRFFVNVPRPIREMRASTLTAAVLSELGLEHTLQTSKNSQDFDEEA